MTVFRVCCEPCDIERMCCDDHSCCIECHCTFEEQYALPYLPHEVAVKIAQEHQELQRQGWPADKLKAHSEWEDEWFRRYCPPEIMSQISHDHAAYGMGKLKPQPEIMQPRVDVGAQRRAPIQRVSVPITKARTENKRRNRRRNKSTLAKIFGL